MGLRKRAVKESSCVCIPDKKELRKWNQNLVSGVMCREKWQWDQKER